MGIFGGIGRALTQPGQSGLSLADRLAIFGTAAQGDFGTAMALRNAPAERAKLAELQRANAEAASLFEPVQGEMRQVPGQMRQLGVGNNAGEDIASAFGPQMEQGPPTMEQGPARERTSQERAAVLGRLARVPGFDLPSQLKLAEYAKPNYQLMNDQLVDPTTARIVRTLPKVGENQQLTFDATGKPIGVIDLQGRFRSLADQAEATTLGGERGKLRDVPFGDGATRLMTGRDYLEQRAVNPDLGYTPPAAQLAAAQTRAVGAATGDVERQQGLRDRISQAPNQLAALNQMRANLPNVISGFGSDIQLNTARAMAAAGNEDAKRRVVATETFLNQGRVMVQSIIKSFGANPTEGERKYAEKMGSADAELNSETMAEGIRLQTQRIYRDYASAGVTPPPAPAAPRQAAQRLRNEVYQTPRGPLVWTGTGWMQP